MKRRALIKFYSELWAKFLAAKSRKERDILANQAHRIWLALGGQ